MYFKRVSPAARRALSVASILLAVPVQAQNADPTRLPVATTLQVPLTVAYTALGVPSLPAGGWYSDPTTNVKVYKLTSATFPASSVNWGHDYAEGGNEISLPYNGNRRAVLVRQNGGTWWLVDFTPGVGVSNPRALTGNFRPIMDLAFTFSNHPATPYYAYVSRGSTIYRFDIRTMTEAPGNGWPVTGETSAMWLHQSENDGMFVWMRGANGDTMVAYEPATGVKKTYTNANMNEPRIDRAGRYVGLSLTGNGILIWDWNTNGVVWSAGGTIPFAHQASLKRRWYGVNWNITFPAQFTRFYPDVPNSAANMGGGPAIGHLVHGSSNWIQNPADLRDQWAVFLHYGSLVPNSTWQWLAPGGMVLITENGQRRLLAHAYNTTSNYTFYSFAKFSPDGSYVMFTSDMNGSPRSDVFLAELPTSGSSDTTPPTASITAPGAGATVSGTITVSANATDNVGVAGVQFKLDGADLGGEDTSAPYSTSWNTTSSSNGSHSLTAVARDAAGNTATSGAVAVVVNNAPDTTPPVISAVASSGITSNGATIAWTTNEASDSQVEFGTTASYGQSSLLDSSLVTGHSIGLSGLAASTVYHFRVRSRDGGGNLAVSGDQTFTTLAPPDLNTGLVGFWKFDEGSGTNAADASGNSNHGTLLNGPLWSAGKLGPGLSFDGVDDRVDVAHSPVLNAYPLTVAAWFKTGSTSGTRGIVNKYVAASSNGYNLFLNNGNLCAWFLRDGSNKVHDGTDCTFNVVGFNDNQWHQAVFVVDASGGKLYVDGVQKGSLGWSGAPGPVTSTEPVHVAFYPGAFGGAAYWIGAIDEVRLYQRALGPSEVLELFNTVGSEGIVTDFGTNGLWSHGSSGWKFQSTLNPIALESWGNKVAVAFGSGNGVYAFEGTSGTYLTSLDPTHMVAWGDKLVIAFAGAGLWTYDASGWTNLTSWDPEHVVAWGSKLAVAFGPGNGLWYYDAAGWNSMTAWDPYDMVSWGTTLAVAFDAGRGLWRYDAGTWRQLTAAEPLQMTSWNGSLAVTFAGGGLWSHDGMGWQLLTGWEPYDIESWGTKLLACFDAGRGLWQYSSGGWAQLTVWEPLHTLATANRLYVELGPGVGLFQYDGVAWTDLTPWSSEELAPTFTWP